jgi:hypothetical protein
MKMTEAKKIARTINKAKTAQCKARRVHKWAQKVKELLALV